MKYYEKEVLSIRADKSYPLVCKYLIYLRTNRKFYNPRKSLFITFMQKGRLMHTLFKVEDMIILNPRSKKDKDALRKSTYSTKTKNRVLNYIRFSKDPDLKQNKEKRFYLLSDAIPLNPPRKAHKPYPGFVQYSLKEILTKLVVKNC